jgi:multiple sugar transport system substrate-binding protein
VKTPSFADEQAQAKDPWLVVASEQLALGLGGKPRTPDWSKVEELLSVQLNTALLRGSLGDALDVAAADVTDYFTAQGYYD